MRIFKNCSEAIQEIEREIFEMGIDSQSVSVQDLDVSKDEDFKMKELIGYTYCLSGWEDLEDIFSNLFSLEESIKLKNYCEKEFQERISFGHIDNPGSSWLERPEVWKKFLHEGKFSYTYHERIHSQLVSLLWELKKVGSRQTIVTVYDSCKDLKNWGGKKRIPCSMYYQFLNRIEERVPSLSLIYTMRSSDFYTHFLVDIYLALKLLQWVGSKVGSVPKRFIHHVGSLHAFKKDYEVRRIF